MRNTLYGVILLLFFFFSSGFAYADSKVDSLLEKAKNEKNIKVRAGLFQQTALLLRNNSPDSSLIYFKHALNLFRSIKAYTGIANSYENIASLSAESGNHKEAMLYADSLYHFAFDTKQFSMVLSAQNIRGGIYLTQGNFELSSQMFFDALKYIDTTKRNGDRRLIIYSNLVFLLKEMKKYDQALQYAFKGYNTAKDWNQPDEVAYACNNIVEIDLILTKIQEAKPYLDEMSNLVEKSQDIYLKILSQMQNGCWQLANKNYQDAILYFQKTVELNKDLIDQDLQCTALNNLGMAYQKAELFDKAEIILLQALDLSFQINSGRERNTAYRLLSNNAEFQKDFKKAFKFSSLYRELSDSLLNEKSQTTLLELETKYQANEKQKQIELLNKEKQLHEATIAKQNLIRNGILIFILLSVFSGWILLNQFKLKKKVEGQQALLSERKRISADLHDDVGSGLSKISLLSELVKQQARTPEAKIEAEKISQTSKELAENIGEIIWALNFNNDFLENLIAYIRRYAAEYFENTSIALDIQTSENIPVKSISGEQRRNIFYAVKEALHNVVKHAAASKVKIEIELRNDNLSVTIHDNGKGMPQGELNRFGNGLLNIESRIKSINGSIAFENHIGTKISIHIPV